MRTHSKLAVLAIASTFVFGCAKKSDEAPAKTPPAQVKAGAPAEEKVAAPQNWDDDLVWPMDAQLIAAVDTPKGDGEAKEFGVGGGKAVAHVWAKMATYDSSYLKRWSDVLHQEPSSPAEVVDAFNELAFAVTGPKGFWRDTLPNSWLGCQNNPESEPCLKLKEAEPELQKWDKIQAKLSKMSDRKAKRFLSRNEARMMAYFDNYVPSDPSASAMKETGFYKTHLDGVMP